MFSKTKIVEGRYNTSGYVVKLFRLYVTWSLIYIPINIKYWINESYGFRHSVIIYIRDFIFAGTFGQLWYLNATIVAVMILTYLLNRKVNIKKVLVGAFVLYLVGLLAQSWFGLIEPLRDISPRIWKVLQLMQKIIVTPRNGVFEGLLFVSIGAYIGIYDKKVKSSLALIGFIFSMLLMLGEFILLTNLHWIKRYDMYLFLVPATVFLFFLVKSINFKDNQIYKMLRQVSILIFYTHMWIYTIVSKILRHFSNIIEVPMVLFLTTLFLTIICAVLIIKLSQRKNFSWIKKFYS